MKIAYCGAMLIMFFIKISFNYWQIENYLFTKSYIFPETIKFSYY